MSEGAKIPLCVPTLTQSARGYLDECIASNFVSSAGPLVSRFEEAFAAAVGSRYAIACASGTAAIHVALKIVGVSDGDEVWVPTLTFVASANPVLYERAQPLLIDAEPRTWNLDPALVVDELARRARGGLKLPRAIEVVHLLGHPVDLEPIASACEHHGVALVEDAAEALGAAYTTGRFAARQVGTVGWVGCFSFNGNKILTTGGGGMLVTDDEALARRARHLTTQARLPGLAYRHDEVGYNYRLSNLAAALGLSQLEQLPAFLEKKRRIALRYAEALREVPGLSLAPHCDWALPSHWLSSILVDTGRFGSSSGQLCDALAKQGIETRPLWTPLHQMPMYRDAPRLAGEIAERLHRRGLTLPSSVGLSQKEQDRVIGAILQRARA